MRRDLHEKIIKLLEQTPGQAIKEISIKLNLNRTFLAGYLQALEDVNYVVSRKVGPARIFMKKSDLGNNIRPTSLDKEKG